jgi:hypothetical protein
MSQQVWNNFFGKANVILNIKLLREGNDGVTLVQSYYVEKILSRFGFSNFQFAPMHYDLVCYWGKNKE